MTNKAQRDEEELLAYFRGMRKESQNTILATAYMVYAVEEGMRKQYGLPESRPAGQGWQGATEADGLKMGRIGGKEMAVRY